MSMTSTAGTADAQRHDTGKTGFWALTLGSIGVVYGDIGTPARSMQSRNR